MADSRELLDDLQASAPEVQIGLSRAGVRGVSKAIRLRWGGRERLIAAEIDCTVDLDRAQKGVHMSRFPELFEEAIEEVVIGEAFLVEELADHIARHIVERHVERILELVPLATHNQRGRGTLYVGTDARVNAEELVTIVEGSMSSPIYELLKRPDELFVVEHAHLQPRFVEDSVRIALKSALERYAALDDDDFLLARQVNFETIHNHEVLAERFGTVGELRGELDSGDVAATRTGLADWLA